jgi:hypothetical protein
METGLTLFSAFLWLLMVGLAGTTHWFAALFVLLVLLLVYGLLGSMHKGRMDPRLILFPVLPWLVLWAVAFGLANYYAVVFAGESPAFTVLGFHPSFAAIIGLFWIIPTLLMGFGFEATKDRWLSQQRWDDYVRRVAEMGAEEAPEETAK